MSSYFKNGDALAGLSLKMVFPSEIMMILSNKLRISADGEWIVVNIAIPRLACSLINLAICNDV